MPPGHRFNAVAPLPSAPLYRRLLAAILAMVMALPAPGAFAQSAAQDGTGGQGPIRLRQPGDSQNTQRQGSRSAADDERSPANAERERALRDRDTDDDDGDPEQRRTPEAQRQRELTRRLNTNEFELYARRLSGLPLKRFGSELVTEAVRADGSDLNAQAPADYVLGPGDEVMLTIWGSVDADLKLTVDRSGRLSIPRVGAVMVAGVRYADLPDVLSKRVGQVFKNFQLAASLGKLRGVRIYVTGFAQRPGAYTVSSLATVMNAIVRAGGPSSAGSLRNVQLRRGKEVVTSLDLYKLLLDGDKTDDRVVQAEDVVHIGPVGPQVAVLGSVNKPAIFELKSGEKISDLLRMAGGFNAVADRTRLALERLDDRNASRITQLNLPNDQAMGLQNGDVVRAFSAVDAVLPLQRQNKRVRVEGEVVRPGEYVLPPESTIADAVRAAGGMTDMAYVFGAEFNRESVRATQQENYDRALRDLETEFARSNSTQKRATADEVTAKAAVSSALFERMRRIRPTGRVVLQLEPTSTELPPLALEDGDRIFVPARATTVGVFGSVFNAGSYLYSPGRTVGDFLRLAGGSTRGADTRSTFVVRANGSVVSARQINSVFGLHDSLSNEPALPGDTVFVPEELDKINMLTELKDWAQIFYQFGLGMAALQTLKN